MKPWPSSPTRLAVGTRTLSKNSSAVSCAFRPILSRLRPRSKPSAPRSTAISEKPMAPASGSVLHTTRTKSALMPFVMKVLDPLMTYSSPSLTAVVWMPCRSDPVPGSVIAMAVIISPEQNVGNQRAFCSSLQYLSRYPDTRSVWIAKPTPLAPTLVSSSCNTALKRKSLMPPPPNSSGIMNPSRPSSPALTHRSRGTIESFSHCSWCGAISLSQNVRTVSRNASWSASNRVRFMGALSGVLDGDAVVDEGVDVVDPPGGQGFAGVGAGFGRRRRQRGWCTGEPRCRRGLHEPVVLDVGAPSDIVGVLGRFAHGHDRRDARVGAFEDLGPFGLSLGDEHLGQRGPQVRPLAEVIAIWQVDAEKVLHGGVEPLLQATD